MVNIKSKIPFLLSLVLAVLIIINIFVLKNRLFKDVDLDWTSTQTMYEDGFALSRSYPDLFLRNLVKDKEIKVARDIKKYEDYGTFGHDEDDGNPFDNQYLIENDYTRWFSLYAGMVTVDKSLPSGEEVTELFGPLKADFTDIGEANDMLRYSFALNREEVQQASAFWYSWYYNTFSEKRKKNKNKDMLPNIYVNLESAAAGDNSGTLVAVWTETQDLYLMSEEKYREYGF